MFTHSIYRTPDMASQGRLLDRVAEMLDAGHLRTTLGTEIADFSAARAAPGHELVKDGKAVGKVVVRR